ncbi:hypothetical protein AB0283_10045 [Micromonospora vinacea]|uniref:hypothetical protein n=1 Tax=Micromonospora vinacea TaxID=709878 RepID=UPI00344D2C72
MPTPTGGDRVRDHGNRPERQPPRQRRPVLLAVNGEDIEPELTVAATIYDEDNPVQRFTIVAKGDGTYAIGSGTRMLQHLSRDGKRAQMKRFERWTEWDRGCAATAARPPAHSRPLRTWVSAGP